MSVLAVLLSLAVALGVGAAAGLYWFHRTNPVGFRSVVFQPIRELSFFFQELDPLRHWRDIERTRLAEPETFYIPGAAAGSVDLAAALYRPSGAEHKAIVVLQHGSYPWGRKGALIRLLATRLSADGWLAVAPDARGFGESGTPPDPEDPQAWRTASDLSRIIDHLENMGEIQAKDIFVLGHSMGANHTLEGGLADDRVKALIAVGPGRFPDGEDIVMPDWERARFSADRRLKTRISRETCLFFFSLGNIRLMADSELATSAHKPILLIDGEKEGAAKVEYLRNVVRRLRGPVEYHTLAGAGHYCGVRSFLGSERVYYRVDLFEHFYGIVTAFLARQAFTSGARGLGAAG